MGHNYNESLPLPEFDRELNLGDLLAGSNRDKIENALQTLINAPIKVVDLKNNILLGTSVATSVTTLPIIYQFETIGYLHTDHADITMAQAVIDLLLSLISFSSRFLMTSDLHIQVIQEDYEKLQKQHEQIKISEESYRQLSENLELRVQEQVQVIETANRKLYEAEKMSSIGQLAAGVAHEINNPIGFVKSNLSSAMSYFDEVYQAYRDSYDANLSQADKLSDLEFIADDYRSLVNESIEGLNRVASIVQSLKDYSNIDNNETVHANINDTILSVVNVIEPHLPQNASISMDLGEVPSFTHQPGFIGQALTNILINSSQAISEGGRITIRTRLIADNIRLEIEDDGPGVDDALKTKIFEPFFTTRDVGHGVGLGLTVAHDIIHSHQGDITLENNPDIGARVIIQLPLTRQGEA